jgi:hypothetical protein
VTPTGTGTLSPAAGAALLQAEWTGGRLPAARTEVVYDRVSLPETTAESCSTKR